MTCDAMRERILEADLAELGGEADTPLTQHLHVCPDCRAVAEKIVQAEADLGMALDAMSSGVRTRRVTARWRQRGFRAALVPLAAAAGIAAVLIGRGSGTPTVSPNPAPQQLGSVPIVEPTDDQNVAVFTTDDPDIVVVWFLGGTD